MKRYIKSAITPISEESFELQLAVARNPRTPPELLRQLAAVKEGDNDYFRDDVLMNVFQNPNTPVDVLCDLASNNDSLKHEALLDERLPFEFRKGLAEMTRGGVVVSVSIRMDDCNDVNPSDEITILAKDIAAAISAAGYDVIDRYFLLKRKHSHRHSDNGNDYFKVDISLYFALLDTPELNKIIGIAKQVLSDAGYPVTRSNYRVYSEA